MKTKPVISILLGCLILVITGHNIVPHHHHSGTLNSHSGCLQPIACEHPITSGQHDACDHSPDHAGESEKPAEHCHAFNELEYVISFNNKVNIEPLTETGSICLISLIFKDEPLPREVFFGCSGVPPPEFTGFLGESSGLRAPPAIS